jgi:excisionase family DNA binding protein
MMETRETNLQDCAISVKDAAAKLGVSQRTVWRMIADEQLTAVRVRGCTRLLLSQVSGCLQNCGKGSG